MGTWQEPPRHKSLPSGAYVLVGCNRQLLWIKMGSAEVGGMRVEDGHFKLGLWVGGAQRRIHGDHTI